MELSLRCHFMRPRDKAVREGRAFQFIAASEAASQNRTKNHGEEFPLWRNRISGIAAAPGCRFDPQPRLSELKDLAATVASVQLWLRASNPWPGTSRCGGVAKKQRKKERNCLCSQEWPHGPCGSLDVLGIHARQDTTSGCWAEAAPVEKAPWWG